MNTDLNISANLGSILGKGTSMESLLEMINDLGLEVSSVSNDSALLVL